MPSTYKGFQTHLTAVSCPRSEPNSSLTSLEFHDQQSQASLRNVRHAGLYQMKDAGLAGIDPG